MVSNIMNQALTKPPSVFERGIVQIHSTNSLRWGGFILEAGKTCHTSKKVFLHLT